MMMVLMMMIVMGSHLDLRVRDFDDYAMNVDTGNDIDDEMGYNNDSD